MRTSKYVFCTPIANMFKEPAFVEKLRAPGNQLVSVVTANSVDKDTVTELILESEITVGKKKVKDTVTLRAKAFFQVSSKHMLFRCLVFRCK